MAFRAKEVGFQGARRHLDSNSLRKGSGVGCKEPRGFKPGVGFRVQGLGFRVWALGFRF